MHHPIIAPADYPPYKNLFYFSLHQGLDVPFLQQNAYIVCTQSNMSAYLVGISGYSCAISTGGKIVVSSTISPPPKKIKS